jgi:HSP20 family molecular chaperone IbpA
MPEVSIRVRTTILDEIEKVYEDVTRRAYEQSEVHAYSVDIEDWLAAEKQIVWKPDVQVIEKQDVFVIRVALDGFDPSTIEVLATTDDVLVHSVVDSRPRVFRAVHLPAPVNPIQLHGTYIKGRMILIAPKIPLRRSLRLPAAIL